MTMFRTLLVLRPAPGALSALVQYYRDSLVIEAAVPYGLLAGELAYPPLEPSTMAVASLWSSSDAYDDWLRAPERELLVSGLMDLLQGPQAITGTKSDAGPGVHPRDALDFSDVYGETPLERAIRVG